MTSNLKPSKLSNLRATAHKTQWISKESLIDIESKIHADQGISTLRGRDDRSDTVTREQIGTHCKPPFEVPHTLSAEEGCYSRSLAAPAWHITVS